MITAARRKNGLPTLIEPMLALAGPLPRKQGDYSFEFKWDGVRCLSFQEGRRSWLQSRSLLDITGRYPELKPRKRSAGMIFDGEIIATDEQNRPSFGQLQRRMHVANPDAALVAAVPTTYIVFDLLAERGKWIGNLPYAERRERLEKLKLPSPSWRLTPARQGGGDAMLRVARQHFLEGLVAKRLESVYLPGQRSGDWTKIKIVHRQEFVVGGWTPEKGEAHSQRIGALLMGYHDETGRLRYAGMVGTGFNAAEQLRLAGALARRERRTSPFADPTPRLARFVEPVMVAEVEYRRWPANGLLQQAAYKGLREDKPAGQVVREAI